MQLDYKIHIRLQSRFRSLSKKSVHKALCLEEHAQMRCGPGKQRIGAVENQHEYGFVLWLRGKMPRRVVAIFNLATTYL